MHKSLQEYFAAEFIYKDSKENQNLILSALYKSSRIERYINLLDLYFDIDYSGFEVNILLPFLKEFLAYHASVPMKLNSINEKLYEERVGLLFLREVYFWNTGDENVNIKKIFDELSGPNDTMDSKILHLLNDGNYILERNFARSCLVNLIANKLPNLVAKGDIVSKRSSFKEGLLKIETNTNSDNIELYEMTNRYLAHLDKGYFLKYSAVTDFVASIRPVNHEAITNDLLSGL